MLFRKVHIDGKTKEKKEMIVITSGWWAHALGRGAFRSRRDTHTPLEWPQASIP